jgi:2-iminobutanoate/2-iminopropanoate deaminase
MGRFSKGKPVMKKETIHSEKIPTPVGPYSQGIKVGNLIFTAGTGPFDLKTGQLLLGDIRQQTRQVLENIKAILQAAGARMEDIVKTTIFLTDLKDWSAMNEVYREYFQKDPPVRSTVQVAGLWGGMAVEIEAIAALSER